MDRSPTVISVALVATTLLALTPIASRWADDHAEGQGPLQPAGGRVDVTVDDQDVGLVAQGKPLEVCFVVRNAGSQRLLLRQTPLDFIDGQLPMFPIYSVSPGQKIAVTAHVNASDLAPQGVTHVLFMTSDPACPRLWFSVRGVVGQH